MVSWFIAPYKIKASPFPGRFTRYCAVYDFEPQIKADGGAAAETEVLGDRAIVKVRASVQTLNLLNGSFYRFPLIKRSTRLSLLRSAARVAMRTELLAMGYLRSEISARFGTGFTNNNIGDVMAFATRRRRQPRYDKAVGKFLFDGRVRDCTAILTIDAMVAE